MIRVRSSWGCFQPHSQAVYKGVEISRTLGDSPSSIPLTQHRSLSVRPSFPTLSRAPPPVSKVLRVHSFSRARKSMDSSCTQRSRKASTQPRAIGLMSGRDLATCLYLVVSYSPTMRWVVFGVRSYSWRPPNSSTLELRWVWCEAERFSYLRTTDVQSQGEGHEVNESTRAPLTRSLAGMLVQQSTTPWSGLDASKYSSSTSDDHGDEEDGGESIAPV